MTVISKFFSVGHCGLVRLVLEHPLAVRAFIKIVNMVQACLFITNLSNAKYQPLLANDRNNGLSPLINLWSGSDLSIVGLSCMLKTAVSFSGNIIFDGVKSDVTMGMLFDVDKLKALFRKPLIQSPIRPNLDYPRLLATS